MSIFLT